MTFFPAGWVTVLPAALSAAFCLATGLGATRRWPPRWRRLLAWLGWAAGASMIAYCLLFWIDLTMIFMLPFGVDSRDQLVGLPLRSAGVAAGALTLWCAATELRHVRSACDRCGRVHGLSPERRTEPSPWWAYAGAYVAVAGLAARLSPALVEGLNLDGPGGAGFTIFFGLMVLAGTLLPLALAHLWGRVWPNWSPWAGQFVPRWLVLGPGVFMGVGLSAYFGVGGMTAMAVGATPAGLGAVLEIGGYTLWGAGLLVASTSYYRLTRPECQGIQTGLISDEAG
ncbi:hypothetical protein [Pseudonocardia xinjiangensis]|uniref:Uncharacterized protein n=1 Tax=Pseudonocardia xinjiangensis TaxID=75289 RepID=A0ABX1RBM1_9PSEU|nr:hypothetical protein [Pseudonocardia xinjiangensis]NMH77196.1 hypothetical protein [Pseudonocardia xinjiangensis]